MADTMQPLPPLQRMLVTTVVTSATLMVAIDGTIANVALPHMKAALSASQDTVSWVLTSYILATAISTPVTGWLSDRVGRRLFFTVAAAGFTGSSVLCGIATSLPMMVTARVLQGLFGASMMPLSQAILYDITPPEKQPSAMALWGMCVMAAPVMGPVAGGYLTDALSWRWCFFINVPIGIVAAIGLWLLLPDTLRVRRRFDALGYALLSIGLVSMQLVLDRGTGRDWFDSTEIIVEAALMVAGFWMFAVHMATARNPVIPLALFKDRTFVSALILITSIGGVIMAGAALIAPMLQGLLGYSVTQAGELTMPRGVGMLISIQIAARLMPRVDARLIMLAGMAVAVFSLRLMTGINLDMDGRLILYSGFLQGIGLGLATMPLSLLAFATVAPRLRTEAASLYSLMRSLGGSIAIAGTTATLAHNIQQSHADLTANLDPSVQGALGSGQLDSLGELGGMAASMVDGIINQQAAMVAYVDNYWLMMVAMAVVAPLILILRVPKRRGEDLPAVDYGH